MVIMHVIDDSYWHHMSQMITWSKILNTEPISHLQRKTAVTLALLFNCYIVKYSTCNGQCETNTLTEGVTDCTTQALPCTEQNSNIIKVKNSIAIL